MNSLPSIKETTTYNDRNFVSVKGANNFSFDLILSESIFSLENQTLYNYCKKRKCMIYLSQTIAELFYPMIVQYFSSLFPQSSYQIAIIKTGEKNKDLNNIIDICQKAKEFALDRQGLMVVIGGGVLMDMVGFAASMFRRKIDYLRIPTTLLGQVDAGIGIKTGVNFDGSKNFIGSYYAPVAVINDVKFLKTLNKEQFLCGLAEIIKMAVITDKTLFELIEANYRQLGDWPNHDGLLKEVNKRAIYGMLEQLIPNFYEKNVERLVDFGHTFSPFIEEGSNYQIPHGFAVAMDIAISTELSFLLKRLPLVSRNRIHNLLLNVGLDIHSQKIYLPELMWNSLSNIKLHRNGNLNLPVPLEIGLGSFIKDVTELNLDLLKQALNNLKKIQMQSGRVLNESRNCI